jgi:hypothetical protein
MKALKSRTNWTIALMFLIGGVEAVTSLVPEPVTTPILFVLGLLAAYFKMNPSQEY